MKFASTLVFSALCLLAWDHVQMVHGQCWANSYGRGVGTVPTGCNGDKDGSLCYEQCKSGFDGDSSFFTFLFLNLILVLNSSFFFGTKKQAWAPSAGRSVKTGTPTRVSLVSVAPILRARAAAA